MTFHPGRLANGLENLCQDFSNWSSAAQEIMHSANHALRQGEEHLAQDSKRGQMAAHQLTEDQVSMKKLHETIKRELEDGQDLYHQA